MALGNIVPAEDDIQITLPIWPGEAEGYTVPGVYHNFLSMNMLAVEQYIIIFDKDKVSIYDASNTKICVSRRVILEGWHVKKEDRWWMPLVKNVYNIDSDLITVTKSPPELLKSA